MSYNPFDKDLDSIVEDDLGILIENEITEGWYVEYKSQIPERSGKLNTIKIIKSIASFANTKGGWIFWGVECDKNFPDKICGISTDKYSNLQDQLSRIVSSNINPTPIYNFKEVQLSSGKIVFIIKVEESPTPPYIANNGVIYQRENNESNPIRDRYIIEKLNEKTQTYVKSIEDFTHFDEYGETKGQSDSNESFLELYLFPKPFNSFEFNNFFSSTFFQTVSDIFCSGVNCKIEIGGSTKDVPVSIGMNSIYTSNDSILIRNINENNIIYKSTTLEIFRNGNLKFLMPLHNFGIKNVPERYREPETIEYLIRRFLLDDLDDGFAIYDKTDIENIQELPSNGFSDWVRMFDGADIILVILIICSQYETLLKENDFDVSMAVGFRARVTNTWRKFLFFDDEKYLENIKKYNIPLTPKEEIQIPNFKNGKSYSIKFNEEINPFYLVSKIILNDIGLPDGTSMNFSEILSDAIKHLHQE